MPSQQEIEQYGQLRQSVSSSQVQSARNEFLRAQQSATTAAERRRRCFDYKNTNRSPTIGGFSKDCSAEDAAYKATMQYMAAKKAAWESLQQEQGKLLQESYASDREVGEGERAQQIRYVQGRSGVWVPVRDAAQLEEATRPVHPPASQQAEPQRQRSILPLIVGVASLAGLALYLSRR